MIHGKMGDVVSLEQGLAINKKSKHLVVETGIPLLRITDMFSQNFNQFIDKDNVPEKFISRIDDLIYSRTGQVGHVFRNQKGVIHNNCFRIDPIDTVDRSYMYWFLKQPKVRNHANNLASGSAQPDLNHDAFKSLDFNYPNRIEDQKRIANILDQYEILIENNDRRIAILEEMGRSLYQEWFVKFRFPGHKSKNLKESSLGLIPEGWEVKRLDDFVVLQRGFDLPKKKRNNEGGVPIYASSGKCGFHDEVKVNGPGLVTGRSGTLGIVTLIMEDFWALNTTLWVKEFKNCSAFYGYYLLLSIGLKNYNSGAAVPTLNRNYVHGLPIVSPSIELIEEFEKYTGEKFKAIDLLKRKNNILRAQRDLLLPKLISGNLSLGTI